MRSPINTLGRENFQQRREYLLSDCASVKAFECFENAVAIGSQLTTAVERLRKKAPNRLVCRHCVPTLVRATPKTNRGLPGY